MTLITRIADKAGTFGSVVSAFGCAACFPAIASIGAALGLGFLQKYEGLFISRLMLAVSVWDLLWPTNRRCAPDDCELPAARN